MRDGFTILILLVAGAHSPALAQSTANQRALDALGPSHAEHRAVHTHPHRATHHARSFTRPAHPTVAADSPPPPKIPLAPPPPPVIKAPVIDVPLHPEPPPPPVPVVATAIGEARPIARGTQIGFGGSSADLNRTTMQALHAFALSLKADPSARAQIDAYAPGGPDDPSTPRRTALARGLAARAVLINDGIASTRIYVRAIGQPHDGGPADRVDLTRSDSLQQTAATP